MFREDVLQHNGTFKRMRRCVLLGPASSLSERAAWKPFQPYLDRVNAECKLQPKTGKTLEQFVDESRRESMVTRLAINSAEQLRTGPHASLLLRPRKFRCCYMGNWNSEKKIKAFTATEFLLMSFNPLLVGFGAGVLADHFFPHAAYPIGFLSILLGGLLGMMAIRGKLRFLKGTPE